MPPVTDIAEVIATLESLAKAATPGEWQASDGNIAQQKVLRGPNGEYIASFNGVNWRNDQALSEAANPATVLKLCAAVREMRDEIVRLKNPHAAWCSYVCIGAECDCPQAAALKARNTRT